MGKSQMKLANRAWRTETKELGWHKGWTRGKKAWKSFCRANAEVTVECQDAPFTNQDEANEAVSEELPEWTP
jgi:hypothetical protein